MTHSLPILNALPKSPPLRSGETRERPLSLVDSYGRTIRDLRLSLTDRCNFRCVYCMDPDVRFAPKRMLLTDTEIVRLARLAVSLGVRRLRLTGGEPALHPTLPELIADLSALGLEDLSMTTNGSVADEAELRAWRDAGLSRITVSMDTLRPERFQEITRSGTNPQQVIETVRTAERIGLGPVKINVVVMRGINEDEIADLAALARDLDVEVRFIEFMPLDSGGRWGLDKLVPADEIIEHIEQRFPLRQSTRERTSSPASRYEFADDTPGRIGIIASVTRPFCGACSRLRITADGKIMPCLFSRDEYDIRALLRGGATDDDLVDFLADATWAKQAGHNISSPTFRQPDRPMSAIGG